MAVGIIGGIELTGIDADVDCRPLCGTGRVRHSQYLANVCYDCYTSRTENGIRFRFFVLHEVQTRGDGQKSEKNGQRNEEGCAKNFGGGTLWLMILGFHCTTCRGGGLEAYAHPCKI